MDVELIKRIKDRTPAFNKSLAEGLACEHMMTIDDLETGLNNTRKYIDQLFHINTALFPKDFKYKGNKMCDPFRHFAEITREYGSKRIANIAPSNTYMVELQFSYQGIDLMPRCVLLPFVRPGGITTLNGASYTVSPVATDVGFSVLNGAIFIPFRRTKLTFKQTDKHFFKNGKREIRYVIWSQIHNEMGKRTKKDLNQRERIESCIAHYFFCQFGVIQTFKRWANADVQIGYLKDFPEAQYPRDQWTVFQSASLLGKHPTGDMVLVIPTHQDSELVSSLVAGFWYVVDVFPGRFVEPSWADNYKLWRTLLGHMVFGDFEHQGKVEENIETHLAGFDKSLDGMTIDELATVGIEVTDIWELLHCLLTKMAHHFYDTDIDETSMYNKRLSVLRYVMDEFNYAVSMFAYMFQSRRDIVWTAQALNEGLKRSFKLNTCIKKLTSEHGEFDTLNIPGDNKVIRVTSLLVPQDRAKSSKGHNKSLIGDSSRLIHASLAEVVQYKNQPKNNPDGRGRLNMYANVHFTGLIKRRPEIRELIDRTQKRFKRNP
jgi:hypothetical protein